MNYLRTIAATLLLLLAALPVWAQQLGYDPLNDKEQDELRDTAQLPNHRLKAYVKFLRARVAAMEALQADAKAEKRGRRIHDLLQDIATLADELDGNMDRFSSASWDIRKSLKTVIEGENEIYLKLRAMKENPPTDPKLREEFEEYRFALRDAIESVQSALESSRKTVLEQNQLAKDKQLKNPDE